MGFDKKIPSYTATGLGISKTGKIQVPIKRSPYEAILGETNSYGQPLPQVGDFVVCSHPGFISMKTVYKVLAIDPEVYGLDRPFTIVSENLNGKPAGDQFWGDDCFVLSDVQVEELKNLGILK